MRPLAKVLKGKISDEQLELVPRSYDIIGSEEKAVAVIEIPEGLDKKLIAESLMEVNKNVKSVLNETSGKKGTFRLSDLELVVGDSNTEVTHKEHGYLLRLDPRKVFFSPREATDRQRIASLVKPGENVCVFFSGCAPYSIAISKKQPLVEKVYSIEINPDAHSYAQENVRINKLAHKIILINDDVRKAAASLKIKFDRIVMPMAVDGEKYLNDAFKVVKQGGIVHFYSTGEEEDLFSEAEKLVINNALNSMKKIKFVGRTRMSPFGIRKYKICLDVQVN